MPSSQKLQILLKPNCTWMFIRWSSTILRFFVPIWNSKWWLRQDLCFKMLLLRNHLEWSLEGPLQSFCFLCRSEIQDGRHRNTYKLYVFCSDMKFKMAATAGLSLTLDPMGKMFQNASSLKPLGQLKPNCPWMIIGRSSTHFCFLCRSEIQDGRHRRT